MGEPHSRDDSFRKLCLKRDKGRCTVTGAVDTNDWLERGAPSSEINIADLEVAHIIPFAYANWTTSSVRELPFYTND